jgi:single-strand DNA-binding protein
MGLNVFTASGNLGRDAEQRFTPNGDSIVSFSLPVVSGYGKNEVTTWINCSVFGKRGEGVLQYLKKGQQVGVSGEFLARKYTNNEGVEKQSLELRVASLQLLGSRPSGTSASAEPQPQSNEQKSGFDDMDDDFPF